MKNQELTQEILKELLHYNPETGIFTWKFRERKWFKNKGVYKAFNKRFIDKTFGNNSNCKTSYIQVTILGDRYYAHRIAFLYMTGKFPENEIDHINHIRDDNRWENLRETTHKENMRNFSLSKNNISGNTGVYYSNTFNKWVSSITVDGKNKSVKYFKRKRSAILARKSAERKYGFHKNHGSIVEEEHEHW